MRELDAILDTSALLCLLEDEPGADAVEQRLISAHRGRETVGASCISLVEVYYKAHQSAGQDHARRMITTIKSWPLEIIYPDEPLCLAAGEIKAMFKISFADAFIAATARHAKAVLIHKDPEFESLGDVVQQKPLPYKARR